VKRLAKKPFLTVLSVFMFGVFASPASAATFGYAEIGPKLDNATLENFKRANTFKLTETGSVTKLSLYAVPGEAWKTGKKQNIKAVIYADSSGKPSELLATGTQAAYEGTTGWLDLPFATAVQLSAGTYWLGFIAGPETKVMAFKWTEVSKARAKNENLYTSGPSNPFGTYTADSEQMSIYATYARPTDAPTVSTKPAEELKPSTFKLNATVNPNSFEVTECKFEFGAYENEVSTTRPCNPELPGSGTTPIAITAQAAELASGVTWSYRAIAKNAGGTSYGTVEKFKTPPLTPTAETGLASSITTSSVTLNGRVYPDDAEVTSCIFEYGTTEAYGHTGTCTPPPGSGETYVPVSAAIAGLTTKTTYHYRVVAGNAVGTNHGAPETFTTS
jgi:hypothetical protein